MENVSKKLVAHKATTVTSKKLHNSFFPSQPSLEKPADSWQIPHTNPHIQTKKRIAGQSKTRHFEYVSFYAGVEKFPLGRTCLKMTISSIIFPLLPHQTINLSTFSPTSKADRLDGCKCYTKSKSL